MSINTIEHDDAQRMVCPIARTFGDSPVIKCCRGQACILWRWEEIMAGSPRWKNALKAVAAETGEKAPYPKAAQALVDDPAAHDLVITRGYCGLGGK